MRRTILVTALSLFCAAAIADDVPVLEFSNVHTALQGEVADLLAKESGAGINRDRLEIALVDLDSDGTPELFAFYDGAGYSGDAGMRPMLFAKDGEHYREVDFALNEFVNSQPDMWTVLPTKHLYRYDFKLVESKFESTFVWDGAAYVLAD